MRKCIIITGKPGSGKSTLIKKLSERLKYMKIKICGVFTPEIREDGKRVGFLVKGIRTGKEEILATVKSKDYANLENKICKLGRYMVFPQNFEKILYEELSRDEFDNRRR